MAATASPAVDVGYLAASYSVPEGTLQTLLSQPTVELVQSLLIQIEAKARDFEDLQSEKLKVDVELDNAIQSGEQRARSLKAAAEKAQKESEELRQQIAREETARQQVETQLKELKSTTQNSSTQVEALESRIQTLESQNRDALATYETKATAYDRLAKELADQHQKFVEVRKQLSTLAEKNQSLENAATNVKFRETNLQQEIELLRKNNDWYDAELKTRTNDTSKFRKEKNAQVAELQRANADASENIDSLRRTETLLRKHIEELKSKGEEDRVRIQQLEDEAANNQSNFRSELDSAKRLTALQQKTAELAKNRLEELQAEYGNLQENAAVEVGQLQADIELERNRAVEAESRIADLESMVENLEREASHLKNSTLAPATPRRALNGSYGTPARAGSPAVFSPGGSQLRGGVMGNTKILAENNALKEQLRNVRDENEEKTTLIAEMMEEMQQLEPVIEELRRTNETLTAQISDISTDLDEAVAEKDSARKEERKARGDLEGVHRECTQLRQHVQDLTIQLRSLIWRRQVDEEGIESLTSEQQKYIADTVNNELPASHSYGDTATDTLISQHLVLYKNIADIQNQNANLLRTIRQVAEQYEGQEALSKKEQQEKDQEELSRLRLQVGEFQDQVKSLTTRSQSYKKERDMYRQVATSRGLAPAEGDAASSFGQSFGQSFNSQVAMTPMRGGSSSQFIPQTPQTTEIPGVDKLVKDLQNQVDILKEESATDRATLKSQVDNLTKDNSQLQTERLRLDSQVRREQDRYSRLEGEIKLLQTEKDTLQERYHSIQTTLAKQDDKVVKAEQEAVDAISRFESLEHELTNLKASQSMWKTIEARLTERSQELTDERDRLTKMVTDIQSLRNEQELTNAENRRRLQDRIDALEGELHMVQRKLEDEVAAHKKVLMQREYERTEAQRRIDDLMQAKNEADVRCASADTARQQLEHRLNEVQTQLQAAEERAQALRPRPASRTNGADQEEEDDSGNEDLAAQISELQRKFDRKHEDFEAANTQIEGYKNIAQEAENALQETTDALETYEREMTQAQEEKDTAIANLQRRVDEISSELATTNSELTELRGQHEQETLRLTQEKDALDTEISRLKNDVSDYKAEAERQTEYVKSQADIATRARQDYEHELAKHGDTMNTLRALRDEHISVKSEIAQFKAQAEAARTALEQSEEHWKSTQSRYEGQIAEAKRTYDDLKQHNKTLLQQFDNYKTQIDDLKSNRASADNEDADNTGTITSGLGEIVTYLRQEKDILEVQLSLKDQEAKRLDSQLTHVQHQLDQTREKLHAAQATAQSSQSGTNLQTLQNQIEQLNVFRESNTTLRNETTRLEAKLAEKAKEMEALQNEVEPLQARVIELEGELELTAGLLERTEKDRDHWQKRHADFVTKSDHVDPKVLDDLKASVEAAQAERDQAMEKVKSIEESVGGLEEKIKTLETSQEAAIEAAKETQKEELRGKFNKRHKQLMEAALNPKQAEIDALTTERDTLQTSLTALQQELENARQQVNTTQVQASQSQEQINNTQLQATQSQEQVTALQQQLALLQSQLQQSQQELQTANAARDEAVARTNVHSSTSADVQLSEEGQIDEGSPTGSGPQLADVQQKLEEAKKQLSEAQNRAFSAENDFSALKVKESFMKDQVAQLERDVAEKSNRIVELQEQLSEAQKQASQPPNDTDAALTSDSQAVPEEVEKLKQQLSEAQAALEEARAKIETTASAGETGTAESQAELQEGQERAVALKAELDEREAKLKELETVLQQRETKVTNREGKAGNILQQANDKIKDIKARTGEEIAKLEAEIKTLKQERQTMGEANNSALAAQEPPKEPTTPVVPVPGDVINTETLSRPTATPTELKAWLATKGSMQLQVLKGYLRQYVDPKDEALRNKDSQIAELNRKIEEAKSQQPTDIPANADHSGETTVKSEGESGKVSLQELEEALAKAKAEQEKAVQAAVNLVVSKGKVKESMLANFKAKWQAIEKIAKETPEEQVGPAVEKAKTAKPPAALAPQAAQLQPSTPTQTPAVPIPQPATAAPNVPQANGTLAQGQQPNTALPAVPAGQGVGRGNTGIAAPGFTGQAQPAVQQQQHQAGRGRGEGVGTGPRALQGLLGAQSSIPRGGGTGIPLPGGRGRGQQLGQQLQQPGAAANAQGAGLSQIGRGGGRGGRGGRGGQQSNQNSPRNSLNPGASQFTPGMGRGQKRGAEDEGEGATRGGKRPRGRGNQGGGGVPQGGAPAAGGE